MKVDVGGIHFLVSLGLINDGVHREVRGEYGSEALSFKKLSVFLISLPYFSFILET